MNRRGFLKLLGGAGVAIAASELLIPERKFFLPPRGGWATRPQILEFKNGFGLSPMEKWQAQRHAELGGVHLVFVTNLRCDGPGSFRDAFDTLYHQPRIIIPTVSGYIPNARFA